MIQQEEKTKRREIEDALYIAMAARIDSTDWKQITDPHEISIWTDGDWDDYYFVFELKRNTGSMRMETIALQQKTYVNLYCPDRLTRCGKVMWRDIIRTETDKLSIAELAEILDKYGITLEDSSVYSAKEAETDYLVNHKYTTSQQAEKPFAMPPVLPKQKGWKYKEYLESKKSKPQQQPETNSTKDKKFEYTYNKATGIYDDIFNMSYEFIKMRHECGDCRFTTDAIDSYVGNLYRGPYRDFEDTFVQMLINYYDDMPYHIKIRLEEYIKHNNNPLCPKECIGTALVQAFIKFDYVDIHGRPYDGHI